MQTIRGMDRVVFLKESEVIPLYEKTIRDEF